MVSVGVIGFDVHHACIQHHGRMCGVGGWRRMCWHAEDDRLGVLPSISSPPHHVVSLVFSARSLRSRPRMLTPDPSKDSVLKRVQKLRGD